jgi:hypothetical protein
VFSATVAIGVLALLPLALRAQQPLEHRLTLAAHATVPVGPVASSMDGQLGGGLELAALASRRLEFALGIDLLAQQKNRVCVLGTVHCDTRQVQALGSLMARFILLPDWALQP